MNKLIRNTIGELAVLAAVAALALSVPFPAQAGPYTSKIQGTPAASSETAAAPAECPVAKDRVGHWKKGKHHRMAMMKNLSPEEREKFKAIRAKLKNNPEVQKAKEAVRSAETKEARREAWKNLRVVSRSQLSAEDQAFLDRIKAKCPKAGKSGHCKASKKTG